jgi:hypothetical protein
MLPPSDLPNFEDPASSKASGKLALTKSAIAGLLSIFSFVTPYTSLQGSFFRDPAELKHRVALETHGRNVRYSGNACDIFHYCSLYQSRGTAHQQAQQRRSVAITSVLCVVPFAPLLGRRSLVSRSSYHRIIVRRSRIMRWQFDDIFTHTGVCASRKEKSLR